MICWKCGTEIKIEMVSRSTECPECKADLHCCKECKFYSPGSHYDCKETVDEIITDKEKSNFCDFFHVNGKLTVGLKNNDKAAAARDAFNALFG